MTLKDTIDNAIDVDIIKLELLNYADVVLDIKDLYLDINIYESLFSNTMSGSITIYDKNNIVKNFPLIGKEKLRIKFKTPSTENVFEKEFMVYEISFKNRIPGKDDNLLNLNFASIPFFVNMGTKISKSYQKKTFSEIAKLVFQNYVQNKPSEKYNHSFSYLSSTEEKTNFVVPNWNIFQTMNWLAKKSEHYGNCDYIFYEDWGGFNFLPISHLKTNEIKDLYFYTPENINFNFSKMVDVEIRRIMSYQEKNLGESKFEMEREGAYASIMATNDITFKNISYNKHNYVLDLVDESVQQLDKHPSNPMSYLASSNPNTKVMYRTKSSYSFDDLREQYNVNNEQKRISQMMNNNSKIIKVVLAGDTRRKLGNVVFVVMPSAEFLGDSIFTNEDFDFLLSGKYIISKIGHHIIKYEGYTVGMELMKDSNYFPIPDQVDVKSFEVMK